MKRHLLHRIIAFILMFVLWTSMSVVNVNEIVFVPEMPEINPIYDNIWGTIYHAEARQCDATPTITGDGSRINPFKASEHRWIAISQEMLDSKWRVELLNDSTSLQFKGKIQYGDTVWVDSPYETINGWWIVRDTKNKRYQNSIDFLQTKGDGDLYNNDKYWSGRFDSIKIYTHDDARLLGLNSMT